MAAVISRSSDQATRHDKELAMTIPASMEPASKVVPARRLAPARTHRKAFVNLELALAPRVVVGALIVVSLLIYSGIDGVGAASIEIASDELAFRTTEWIGGALAGVDAVWPDT
jgi:hypothetical protein